MQPDILEKNDKIIISQRDNFNQKFGLVLRSSAIFYYKSAPDISTTLSFMNYWKLKRGIEVAIVASTRDMAGTLIKREELSFENGEVINYTPDLQLHPFFEGSIEIEVFSTKNLNIPYAAIMAIYETKQSISMVHSYSRTYSPYEIEEGQTITKGEESCWTLRDTATVRSFCVFHNGGKVKDNQTITLRITGPNNEIRQTLIELPSLLPYSTVKLYPSDYFPDLSHWLVGQVANANISFAVSDAFTRLLVGNESLDGLDYQITHSNFNYSNHGTDKVDIDDIHAYMNVPDCDVDDKYVIIYPDSDPGSYEVSYLNNQKDFQTGEQVLIPVKGEQSLTFKKKNGVLPTRLVTGLVCENDTGLLPAECSLGVMTCLRPPKKLWWCLCVSSFSHHSKLIIVDNPQIYKSTESTTLNIRLYSSAKNTFIETTILYEEHAENFSKGMNIRTLFPNAQEFLNNTYGYFTVYSEYGGLYCFTMISNLNGSYTLEHGF